MTDIKNNVNESMLDLFVLEVDTHSKKIIDLTNTLDQQDDISASYETLINATRAIKGAAKLVHIDVASGLIESIESAFSSLQKKNITLDSDGTNTITNSISLLKNIANLSVEELNTPSDDLLNNIKNTQQQFKQLLSVDTNQEPEITPSTPEEKGNIEPIGNTPFDVADPIDSEMFSLFLIELQNSLQVIGNNLLEIEDKPEDNSLLEAMMRAAHSIKGAARMIGIEAVVKLSHSMEDVFVAAQNNKIKLAKDSVDQLFVCVDLLKKLEDKSSIEVKDWSSENTESVHQYIHVLNIIQSGTNAPIPKPIITTKESPAEPESKPRPKTENIVRVSADRINKLVGLAGELTVTTNWVREYSDSMLQLKRKHNDMLDKIERLRSLLDDSNHTEVERKLITDLQHNAENYRESLTTHIFSLDNFDRRSSSLSSQINHEVISSRMRPFSDSTQGYKRMVRDISNSLNKKVTLEIHGENTAVDRDILEKLDAPLNHMIRNAIDHGIESPEERLQKGKPETGKITVNASHQAGRLLIQVKDDGRGVDTENLREKILSKKLVNEQMAENLSKTELLDFLFLPSFSTRSEVTELSGRGVGLDIVHSALQEIRGKLHADTEIDHGMEINMELPLTLSVIRSLLVKIKDELYAFPLAKIQSLFTIKKQDISILEDKQYITINDKHIGLIHCAQILGEQTKKTVDEEIPIIIIGDWNMSYGLVVDELIGEKSLALRTLNKKLGKIKDISAAALTDDGEPVLVFDTDDLLQSIQDIISGKDLYKIGAVNEFDTSNTKRVLIVDDSLTVREIEKKLLESKGYIVDVAVDGVDGWNIVRNGNYDLVISDVDMPRMNGIELIKLIKADASLRTLPVMMVSYKDRAEDKQKGLEAGADYYLTKGSFHDETLIEAVVDLIGEAES
jgi:two-component system, chemotaxis family, sensor histidine kinase and response regulator WspE